jgi:uncharacterized membrane protein
MTLTGRLHLLVHFPIALILIAAIADALATSGMNRLPRRLWLYRVVLVSAAALIAVAGHFGAVLAWGADFLRPS